MTNQELYNELKEMRKEMLQRFDKQEMEHNELKKDLNVFKVRAAYFMGGLSFFYAIGVDYIKKKLGM